MSTNPRAFSVCSIRYANGFRQSLDASDDESGLSLSGEPQSESLLIGQLVVGTMLDEASAQQTGCCSDCGCTFNLSQPESDPESSSPSASPQQQAAPKAGSPLRCPSCTNGERPHRRVRLDPHSCTLCTKTFISSAHLALHLTSHKERRFRCSTCGKYFQQSAHLMAHKMIHSGDRPFKCPDCGKAFGRASHLKTHRRLHTGEKPFKCTYCDKSFTQKAGLLAHVRQHTHERLYKCDQCGEAFRTSALLVSHKAAKSAKPGSAAVVGEAQKVQSCSENLKCGVCCRTFVRSSYFRLHIHLDKGQRPYHCKVCNKTFVKLDTFVNHCDKHLRQKSQKNTEEKEEAAKPSFVPTPTAKNATALPVFSEVNTRSRAKARSKSHP